ncbi:MAG: FIST C-terminal domain-containing protein [Phycisphaeraceae bacterium]|nr:MAG: FIST C-terminal domain-containing protein [Phycisphaeraceae bacterium]
MGGSGVEFFSSFASSDDYADACGEACAGLMARAGRGGIDLLMVWMSGDLREMADEASREILSAVSPRRMIGSTAEGLIHGPREYEGVSGVVLLGARLPGVGVRVFTDESFPVLSDTSGEEETGRIGEAAGCDGTMRGMLVFADPYSVPMVRLMPALNASRAKDASGRGVGVIVGGMASGASGPGVGRLFLDDRVMSRGLVGVTLSGGVGVEAVVSQGCRGVGPTLVVTRARGNVILGLGGRPALEVVREVVEGLPEHDQARARSGLMMGRVINEYKDRFGRDDFLIRGIVGADQTSGAVAIGDLVRVGQTVRLHVRDATTASEDLGLLMDGQRMKSKPAGVMMVTCNGRGGRFFPVANHDAGKVAGALGTTRPAEEVAKGGRAMGVTAGAEDVPMGGFFAAGEIGPVGGESYVHGQSACVVLFRRPGEV